MYEIVYQKIKPKKIYEKIVEKVLTKCFEEEKLEISKISITVTLTDNETIQQLNREYRNIDKATDVLSFPMFEKDELLSKMKNNDFIHEDILGDIIISIPRVEEQAEEYAHSFEREFSYMLVHAFYHLMGYDHIKEEDKILMRPKEEKILSDLSIFRDSKEEG